jgi:pantoate--beta-alanine ligase
MQTVENIPSLRAAIRQWRAAGETVAFVPTMGNLHAGHLRLAEEARALADRTVVSVFVNPTQFGPSEDFAAYPRTLEQDAELLREVGVDLLFAPAVAAIYPNGAATFVEVPGLSDILCGHFRPGHFRGVTTVVCKLFNMVQPDIAVFGEKDFQQLMAIRRMSADLNLPVRVVGVPTVREANGLAMSSRNAYLTDDEKDRASLIYRALGQAGAALAQGRRDYAEIEREQGERLADGGFRLDYFSIRRLADLAVPEADERDFVILAAARLGKARLIDNLQVRV